MMASFQRSPANGSRAPGGLLRWTGLAATLLAAATATWLWAADRSRERQPVGPFRVHADFPLDEAAPGDR